MAAAQLARRQLAAGQPEQWQGQAGACPPLATTIAFSRANFTPRWPCFEQCLQCCVPSAHHSTRSAGTQGNPAQPVWTLAQHSTCRLLYSLHTAPRFSPLSTPGTQHGFGVAECPWPARHAAGGATVTDGTKLQRLSQDVRAARACCLLLPADRAPGSPQTRPVRAAGPRQAPSRSRRRAAKCGRTCGERCGVGRAGPGDPGGWGRVCLAHQTAG